MNPRTRTAALFIVIICAASSTNAQKGRVRAPQPASNSQAQATKPDPLAKIKRDNNFVVSLMNRQQFEAALGKFQRACIMDAQSDVGCLNSGIALLNMQQFDDARRILAKSAERDPQNPRVWFNLGLLEKATDHPDVAIEDFAKAAE